VPAVCFVIVRRSAQTGSSVEGGDHPGSAGAQPIINAFGGRRDSATGTDDFAFVAGLVPPLARAVWS